MDFFFVGKNNFAVLNAVQPIELPEQWHQQAAVELKTMLLQTQIASLSCKYVLVIGQRKIIWKVEIAIGTCHQLGIPEKL